MDLLPLCIDAGHCRRIGVISDSHGPVDPRILDALGHSDCIIHAGDSGNADTLDALAFAGLAVTVRGNNDTGEKWGSTDSERLLGLPDCVRIDVCNGHFIVLHGHQFPRAAKRHQQLRERFADAIGVIYGHSHHLQTDCDESPWILNPGACGRARTFGGPSALVLHLHRRRWRIQTLRFES